MGMAYCHLRCAENVSTLVHIEGPVVGAAEHYRHRVPLGVLIVEQALITECASNNADSNETFHLDANRTPNIITVNAVFP